MTPRVRVFSRGKLATLIAVLGVKTNQRVPLSLAVDVSPRRRFELVPQIKSLASSSRHADTLDI